MQAAMFREAPDVPGLNSLSFVVPGRCVPQGSLTPRLRRGKLVAHHGPRVIPWRQLAALQASNAMLAAGLPLWSEGAVDVCAVFYRSRPKQQTRAQRAAPHWTCTPDADKLLRALLDAMTGVVYRDDSQVVSFDGTRKLWAGLGSPERTEVTCRLVA